MSRYGRNSESNTFCKAITFVDFELVWAGPRPFCDGFCVGSEDGVMRFTDEEGNDSGTVLPASAASEAINGVAFSGDVLAATTRSDVTFWHIPIGPAAKVSRAVFLTVAHGSVA